MVYGRAGEEIFYLRARGFEPTVIPGLSSAITAPLFAGIPITQRGVAESFVVCTGVGRGGKDASIPGYRRERTVVLLMSITRIHELLAHLIAPHSHRRDGLHYPGDLPVAIVERASLPDQRVIYSTLTDIREAMESIREHRPPGLIVVGWAVMALSSPKTEQILDTSDAEQDRRNIDEWLGGKAWKVVDGLVSYWQD